MTVTGPTNAGGTADSLARSDHEHRLELGVQDSGGAVGSRPTLNFTGSIAATDDGGNDRVDVNVPPIPGSPELLWGAAQTQNGTRFLWPGFSSSAGPIVIVERRVTRAGTLQNLMIQLGSGPVNPVTFTVFLNGVATTLTATVPAAGTQAQDLINTAAVAQGDRLAVQVIGGAMAGGQDPVATVGFF